MKRTPEGYRPVGDYSAAELHEMLVADAVKRHATYLPWAVAAYDRIGKLTNHGAEQAFTDVLDEVESLTGLRAMPVAPATTKRELRSFGL